MARYFYRQGINLIDAATQKTLTPSEFGQGAGFIELSAIPSSFNTKELQQANFDQIRPIGNTLYGIPKQQQQQIASPTPTTGVGLYKPKIGTTYLDSSTIQIGTTLGNVGLNLPSTNANQAAQNIYASNALDYGNTKLAELQKQLNELNQQRLKDIEAQKSQEEAQLKTIQESRQKELEQYEQTFQPLQKQAADIYGGFLTSVRSRQGQYDQFIQQKMDLTNDIINYSKMMQQEIEREAARPAVLDVSQGRQNVIQQTYISKISTAQAAMQAIDGNFTLAFDIMNQGANAINQLTADRLNFLKVVQSLYDVKEEATQKRILSLTNEEKTLIDKSVADLEAQISQIEKNKETIQNIMISSPIVAQKAGLLLTDSSDVIAKKLQNFYVNNPQYIPENQEWIKKAMEKYYDADISLNDPLETVKNKITNSQIYKKENMEGKYTLITDPVTGNPIIFNTQTGELGSAGTMRTDRHNNPTAMTTDVAKSLGLIEGVDYEKGDPFPDNPNLFTARLLGDPIETTIKGLDIAAKDPKKMAFFTQSGQQRWAHTQYHDAEWLAATPEQKRAIVASMYQNEGGSGALLQSQTSNYSPNIVSEGNAVIRGDRSIEDVDKTIRSYVQRYVDEQGGVKPIAIKGVGENSENLYFRPKQTLNSEERKKVQVVVAGAQLLQEAERLYNNAVGGEYSAFGSGVVSRFKGLGRFITSAIGINQNWKIYQNFLDSNRDPIAKGIKGGVGNLTEGEQKRALKTLPGKFSSPKEAKAAFDVARRILLGNINNLGEFIDYSLGTIVEINGKKYVSVGNNQFEEITQ